MSEINQVINNIKEAFEKIHKGPAVYSKKIFTYIFKKCKDIPDTELYDIIGETFKSNPQNFMKYIHNDLRKKFSKKYGVEKLREMDRYILENFCFYSGEQILYECDGRISLKPSVVVGKPSLKPSVVAGRVRDSFASYGLKSGLGPIYFTNYRLIAQGDCKEKVYSVIFYKYAKRKTETAISDISEQEDLPCYGYTFPTKNLSKLKKKSYSATGDISYKLELDDKFHTPPLTIKIHSPSFKIKMEENINKAYDVLLKSSKNLKEI